MDNTGEDSGLDIEDNSNIADENVSLQQAEGIDETDEGISFAGNLSNPHIAPCFLPRLHFDDDQAGDGDLEGNDGDNAVVEADVQAALYQQQLEMGVVFAENSNSSSANQQPSEENSSDGAENEQGPENGNENENENDNDNGRREELEVPPVGDDNNNDRPDDVNNNTTDPQLQQLQEEQQQLLLRQRQQMLLQQQQQLLQNHHNQVNLIRQTQQSPLNTPDSQNTNDDDLIETPDKKGKDKRKKKKKKKKNRLVIGSDGVFRKQNSNENSEENAPENSGEQNENDLPEEEVEIEYVPEKLELSVFDPMYRAFANVFENFRISEIKKREEIDESKQKAEEIAAALTLKKIPKVELDDDLEEFNKDDEKPKLSKRKLKKLTRLSIAELKQVVPRPDVVEMHDVTARDPKLLVHLKSYRNTVPVPRHWCYKRKYLQGKRGIEKAPFDLPAFIKKTGIMEMRAALAEKEETKTLKAKIRERVRPKMGKIDIDYQKLHDAFFKWQSKPKMTIHGDLYYEGKEFETRMKDKKPGELSDDLRTALGMPVGPNSQRVPPPWLIAMQRYGPPPSYPHLKVPGLNAPIPEGCSFGYHAGGWGKPPVDEFGRPLYGDVFGLTGADGSNALEDEVVDTTLWGELESEEEVESEEEEDEDEEEKEETEVEESGLQTPAEGLQTPSGFSSIPAGLETPELIELRKKRIEQDMEGGETPSLYTVLPEKRVDRISGSMMASTHTYDLSGVNKEKAGPAGPRGINIPGAPMGAAGAQGEQGRVELILDPSELDLVDNEGTLAARYEQQLKEQQSHLQKEDLSDMVAEHAAKQKSKRKRQMQQQDVKQAKKYKEFKF